MPRWRVGVRLNARASQFIAGIWRSVRIIRGLICDGRAMVSADGRVSVEEDGARLAKIEFARTATADDGPGDRIFLFAWIRRIQALGSCWLGIARSAWGGWSLAETYFYGRSGTWWLAAQVGAAAFSSTGGKSRIRDLRQRRAWERYAEEWKKTRL